MSREKKHKPRKPPQGQIKSLTAYDPADEERQRQDFLAGTVFAAGAGVALPDGDGLPIDAMFVVFVHEDERTFGPAPQLQEAFALLDEHGAVETHDMLTIATSWSGLMGQQPLVKLKLDFQAPLTGSAHLVLLADQYAGLWHHIVRGGMVGVSTIARMDRATSGPGKSFSDGMEACLLLGIGTSPVIGTMIDSYGWPRR